MNHRHTNTQAGFTMIELLLAMTFIAVLLIGIALTVVQIGTTYNRGLTLTEVNQAARGISDDLHRTFSNSNSFDFTNNTTNTDSYTRVMSGSTQIGGRLCLGTYSYIWNLAPAVEAGTNTELTRFSNASGNPVRLVRVSDNSKQYCARSSGALVRPHVLAADWTEGADLLEAGDHSLNIISFGLATNNTTARDELTGAQMYTVTYTLGSGAVSAMNLTASPQVCRPPSDPNSNLTYCNIQQFTVALTAGNGVN